MKYCPNCLKECSVSPYGGYACNSCEVLQYANSILLNEPDIEKQKDYKLRKLLERVINPNIQEEGLNNLIEDIKNLLTASPAIKI